MSDFENFDKNKLDIYISYNQLTAKSLGELLNRIGNLGDEILYSHLSSKGFLFDKADSLVIDYIYTGNSIKFRFGEGWLPTITNDENNDIVINTPKKIGIPLLVGYFLLTSVQKFQDIKNKHLDNRIKQIEIQLKESELKKILEPSEKTYQFQKESDKVIQQVLLNQDFNVIQIFDIDIKNIEENKDYK